MANYPGFLDITGVRFTDAAGTLSKHTLTDYGMYLASRPEIDPPKPKTVYVDIPGADGKLDLTEAVTGEVAYENRTVRFEFAKKIDERDQANFMATVNRDLHGKKLRVFIDRAGIIPPGSIDSYYEGRVSVAWTQQSFWKLHCVVTMDAFPYRIMKSDRSQFLENSLVQSQDPLIVPVTDWHDVLREKRINAITHRLEFGTAEFPADCFYGFEWVEIVFEKSQLGKTVDVTAYDANNNSWTHATNVISRTNSVTGEIETYVNYSLTSARDNGVNPRTLYRIDVKTSASSANTERLGYVAKVNVKISSPYAALYISTDMPSYPEVIITSGADDGYYLTWNGKGYSSNEFSTGRFEGIDERLRLIRGKNIITMRPRDTTVDNYLMVTYRAGGL